MGLPALTINRTSGGIGRQAPGVDYYSGMVHYFKAGAALPSGFLTNPIRQLNSLTDLVALGVANLSEDETKASGSWTNTVIGNTGDVVTLSYVSPYTGASTTLGAYTKVAGDTTVSLVATAVAAAINALTYVHGFTAVPTLGVVAITAKTGFGASLNSGAPLVATYSAGATLAGTLIQFSGGVGSEYDVLYYNVAEFFRMQGIINGKPQGQLWLGCYVASATTAANFTEVATLQSFATGQCRQIGVFLNAYLFASSHVTALQAQATALQTANTPTSIVYQPDISTTYSVLTSLPNLRALTNKNVSVCIGQDGANRGYQLYKNFGKSIGMLGTTLGAVALAAVNESLVWRGKFNAIDVLEFITLGWGNGALQSASGSGLSGLLTALDASGYIFLMHETDLPGSYFNNDNTANLLSSNYAYIADNRTIDKAVRLVRAAVLPALGSPLTFNTDGTLTADTVGYFEGLGDNGLAQMINASEISQAKTIVNPAQLVQQTQTLVVTIQIIQRGVARNITINIGFVASLTS